MHCAGSVCSFYVVFGWNAAARIIKPKESTLNASTASNKSATHTKKSGHLLADRRTCGATACGLRANTADGVTVKVAGRVGGERPCRWCRSDARSRLCAAWPPAKRLRGAVEWTVRALRGGARSDQPLVTQMSQLLKQPA